MVDITTPPADASSVQGNAFPLKPIVVVALAALADWLFYEHSVGISAVIFAIALACGSLLVNFTRLNRRQTLLAGVLLFAGLIPAIEAFNITSLTFMVLALGVGLLLTTNREVRGIGEHVAALCDLYLVGPFRLIRDGISVFSLPALATGFTVWLVPVIFGGIFVFLLVSANPLLEKWIG